MFEKIATKLNEPKTHRGIALLLTMGSMLAPQQYQVYILALAGVLGFFGYVLPDGTQKRLDALVDAHKELAAATLPVAEGQGVDTTASHQATAEVQPLRPPPASP